MAQQLPADRADELRARTSRCNERAPAFALFDHTAGGLMFNVSEELAPEALAYRLADGA